MSAMMYAIKAKNGTYVNYRDNMLSFVGNPFNASRMLTRESASEFAVNLNLMEVPPVGVTPDEWSRMKPVMPIGVRVEEVRL